MDRPVTRTVSPELLLAAALSLAASSCATPRPAPSAEDSRIQAGICPMLVVLLTGGLALLRLVPQSVREKGRT